MLNVSNYGTDYVLIANNHILDNEEINKLFLNTLAEIGIDSPMMGVTFDGLYLVPSVGGFAQTHKKCEFTMAIKAQAEIAKLSAARGRMRKAISKLKKEHKGSKDEFAIAYVKAFGTIKIEGEGARSTNYGIGCTLTVNSGDAQEAKEIIEKMTIVCNKDSRNNRATHSFYLTTENEVADVMIACGFGDYFLQIIEEIKPNQVFTKTLTEIQTDTSAVAVA
ncbi:MAG: hypothetical protein ACOCUT_00005 [bacterium]